MSKDRSGVENYSNFCRTLVTAMGATTTFDSLSRGAAERLAQGIGTRADVGEFCAHVMARRLHGEISLHAHTLAVDAAEILYEWGRRRNSGA